MPKNDPEPKKPGSPRADHALIIRLFGEMEDAKAAAILALEPTVEEVEEVASWLAAEGQRLAKEGHPLTGTAARIYDILSADEWERWAEDEARR